MLHFYNVPKKLRWNDSIHPNNVWIYWRQICLLTVVPLCLTCSIKDVEVSVHKGILLFWVCCGFALYGVRRYSSPGEGTHHHHMPSEPPVWRRVYERVTTDVDTEGAHQEDLEPARWTAVPDQEPHCHHNDREVGRDEKPGHGWQDDQGLARYPASHLAARRPHDNDDGRVNGEDEEEGDTQENSDVVHGEGGVGTSWKHVGGETLDVLGIKLYRYFMWTCKYYWFTDCFRQ